ncbi:DUF4238 domain-containing protein [Photobacterium kishitanii]|uniref:DUF4238 domain-containing protein n=1 Tax=Photobacterium kishitanii TaxID=318456 RepID=UPI00071AEE2D|nr:DUF4238 domain-containing protein [Photobacterium kishitanii]
MKQCNTINKDHFVPKFYLRNWYSSDKYLRSARVDIQGKDLQWKPFTTTQICYEKGLYREQEERFYKPLDNDCTGFVRNILCKQNFGKLQELDIGSKEHELWAKYILSQLVRTPENINKFKKLYSDMPESVVLEAITNASIDQQTLLHLRSLTWIVGFLACDKELITSDSPAIFEPRDLNSVDCFILMPLSPKHFFLATREENVSRFPSDPEKMVRFINSNIYRGAQKRIIACTPSKVVGLEQV